MIAKFFRNLYRFKKLIKTTLPSKAKHDSRPVAPPNDQNGIGTVK